MAGERPVVEGQPSYKSEAAQRQEAQAEARSRVHPVEEDRGKGKDRPDKGRDKDTPDSPEDSNSAQVAQHPCWN